MGRGFLTCASQSQEGIHISIFPAKKIALETDKVGMFSFLEKLLNDFSGGKYC